MRAPLSWIREFAEFPADMDAREVANRLIHAGLEVETVLCTGEGLSGDLVVGRVTAIEELTQFRKPIRWCQVDVGAGEDVGIICGARNFSEGDLVVVAPPGTTLPGDFTITARKTYDHVSNGMICSERELGLGDDHAGIIVLPSGTAEPGEDAAVVLGVGEQVLDIAVTPDRGYALSVRGVAREVAIAFHGRFLDPVERPDNLPAPNPGISPAECASEDLSGCPFFTLRTLSGFDPSKQTPQWMVNRLRDSGMRSVSLAVDVTNYVMLEMGQPLHAFDLDTLQGPVRVGRAVDGETLETIDHVVRTLNPDDLTIRDDRGPIGLAGTMGGFDTEITETTTKIALEAAFFEATTVARMGRRHRLSSEASRRFERGIDRTLAPVASARAAELLINLGGGVYAGMTAVEAPLHRTDVQLRRDLPAQVAGLPITDSITREKLEAIGCLVTESADGYIVNPPSWRPDLTDPADLVEEVIRLVGYGELPSVLPHIPAGRGLTWIQRLHRRVGAVLASRGLSEVLSYPFVSSGDLDSLRWADDDARRRVPKLANPLSDEEPLMRGTLLVSVLSVAQRNVGRGLSDLALYEIGSVFLGEVGDEGSVRPGVDGRPTAQEWQALTHVLPDQPTHVAVLLAGDKISKGWWGPAVAFDWADAIEVATVVAESCSVSKDRVQVTGSQDATFHPGRQGLVLIDGVSVGCAGELHPGVVDAWGLPARACAMELNLSAVMKYGVEPIRAPRFSTQPVAKEDVALVVPVETSAESVRWALQDGAGELVESVSLFDVYQGSQVPQGAKSLAFSLRFRSEDKTLAAEDIASVRAAAIARASELFGARLR